MARKNLLRDLLAQPPAPAPEAAPEAAAEVAAEPAIAAAVADRADGGGRARPARGAIGAVGRGIADLKARAVVDLDAHLIDAGGLADRLEHDPADHARLLASLRDYGQQVPVLVRPHPAAPGRYRVVYGRRRIRALRELGLPVKALVRELDDVGAVLAQGQENTARRDLSFIEKANFARQMAEAGFERRIVCDALAIDKTVLSRMLSVTERVPHGLIALVGSAPGIGRDRWLGFAARLAAVPLDPDTARDILAVSPEPTTADGRFEILDAWLAGRRRGGGAGGPARGGGGGGGASREVLRTADGRRLADVTRGRAGLTLTLPSRELDGFDDWLARNLAAIHDGWRAGRGSGPADS